MTTDNLAGKRRASKPLTVTAIKAMKVGGKLSDGATRRGAGRLKVRKRATAAGPVTEWLFLWHPSGAKASTLMLGKFAASEAPDFLTLEQARDRARELQALVRDGVDPKAQREVARATTKAAGLAEVATVRESAERTLGALLTAYVERLQSDGKESAPDVANLFSNHVEKAFPELFGMPAAEVTPEHVSRILARLVGPAVEVKKGRTALKLRSYMAAAFKLALGASTDPMGGAAAAGFGLATNPAAAVPATTMAAKFNKAGERTLSRAELRRYLAWVDSMPGVVGWALRLQLVAGGQRVQQMLRLQWSDVAEESFTLYDPKGARKGARTHALPMLPEIREILTALWEAHPEAGPVFASRGAAVAPESLSAAVLAISDAMVWEGSALQPFRGGDIRRTVETLLAGELGISKDTRAQLLSHGLTGVQDRHYDKATHLASKHSALRAWNDWLADSCIAVEGVAPGNVVRLRA